MVDPITSASDAGTDAARNTLATRRTLLTGPSGFVGATLIRHLLADPSRSVVAAFRNDVVVSNSRVRAVTTGDLSPATPWERALDGVDSVVHLAARVHVMRDTAADPLAEFCRVNVEASLQLARQAASAGVRRFVYISSIKVNGERTTPGRPFRADDTPQPVDPYGVSKYQAEQALHALASATGMELVVIRPPLVYGPGVRANFRSLMSWLRRGIPLPLGAIHNRRSLVALDNLCDLIVTCLQHPAAADHTFLASDGEDLSTTALLQRLGDALGHRARLLPVPPCGLRMCLGLLGKGDMAQRLCGSLQVDIGPARELLGWRPPISVDEGLRRAAAEFLSEPAT